MKFGLVCSVLVLFLMQPGSGARALKNASNRESPKALFARNCATCHGADGRGETLAGRVSGVPDMTDRKWQERVSDKRMAASVAHGRGSMPSFKEKLSPDEIASLVSHVRNFKN